MDYSATESNLDAINCGSALVSTWKGIYKKHLSFLQAGEVDSADHSALKTYSSLCSDVYGKPIHLARALTATIDTTYYEHNDDCIHGMEPRIDRESIAEKIIKVWPNPTGGVVHLELPENYAGLLTIMDISGRTIKTQRIEKSAHNFIELPLSNGMYLLNFKSEDGRMEQHKIMVLK